MTAIEELRLKLDELGVPHLDRGDVTMWGQPIDHVTGRRLNVYFNRATAMGDDRLYLEVQLATPARAIAATIGEIDSGGGSTKCGTAECAGCSKRHCRP